MKWAVCDVPEICDQYVGVFDSSATKRKIKDAFKKRVAKELRKRGFDKIQHESEWDSAMEQVENNVEITSMRPNRVYEIDYFGNCG